METDWPRGRHAVHPPFRRFHQSPARTGGRTVTTNSEAILSGDSFPRGKRSVEGAGAQAAGSRLPRRGRYFTLDQAAEAYPVFTRRLLTRLVQQRRIAFSRAGRIIVLGESDIEEYLEANRVEPPRSRRYGSLASLRPDPRRDRA
jgi:hypothetical protein